MMDYNIKPKETNLDTSDLEIINSKANIMAANFLFIGLTSGAAINFVSEIMVKGKEPFNVMALSISLIILGILAKQLVKINLSVNLTSQLLALIAAFSIPFIVIQFQDLGGGAVWAISFIYIIGSQIFANRTVFLYVILSSILTQIYIWIKVPLLMVPVNTGNYITKISLLIITILIVNIVNRVYVNILKENISQVDKIQQLAYYDPLTGLPNRLLLTNRLNQEILAAKHLAQILPIMFLDLDNFKMINDTIGHAWGDQLLIDVGKRLIDDVDECSIVARFGGDEFIILVKNQTDLTSVKKMAEKILAGFVQPFKLNNQEYNVTASIGVALYPQDGEDEEKLIKNADIAMYAAKEKGRNQYVLCTPVMKKFVHDNMELSNYLHRAVERNELILYYQPQISCATGKIIGCEALLRWHHPELGLLPPSQFVPIAEQTGLILSIGEWVLNSACQQNKLWQNAGLPPIRMAVNLSVQQLFNPLLLDQVAGILNETGLSPRYLELELTETIEMKEIVYIVGILNSFRELGINIAIDDFGTEYSSLNYLKQLPIDRIKIAMPFVQGIGVNDKDEVITKSIISVAQEFGVNVIAEGVETKQQLDFLNRWMCDEIQGYYFYKPMPGHEMEKLLRNSLGS